MPAHDRDLGTFVTRLMQGDIPEDDMPDSFLEAAQPRERVLDEDLIEDASIQPADDDVADAEAAARIDITYTERARSQLGVASRDAELYAYLVDDDELIVLDRVNNLVGAFYSGHTEPGLGLSDITDSIVESVSETVPGIELGTETHEYGTANSVTVHPTADDTGAPDVEEAFHQIAASPDSGQVWDAGGYRIWEAEDHYIMGRVNDDVQEIEVERVADRNYDIDLSTLRNNVSVDMEHDYQGIDLANVPDTLLDMAEQADQRGPLGLHCRQMGDSTILAQVDDERHEIDVLDIGEYDIAFTNRAQSMIEKKYEGGTREDGIKAALKNTVLTSPETNELAKRQHATGEDAPPVGYASVDKDHRLYFAYNQETKEACVLVAGTHEQLQDWYRSDTGELVDEAAYLLESNDMDPDTYLGNH